MQIYDCLSSETNDLELLLFFDARTALLVMDMETDSDVVKMAPVTNSKYIYLCSNDRIHVINDIIENMIHKRPLLKAPISASSKTPQIYVSSSTPFMSAIKRVQKHLDKPLRSTPAKKNASLHSRVEALQKAGTAGGAGGVVVTVLGTGRAIEKVSQVAGWFEQKPEYQVKIYTKTVSALDDIVPDDQDTVEDETRVRQLSCLEAQISLT